MNKRSVRALAAAALLMVVVGCSKDDAAPGTTVDPVFTEASTTFDGFFTAMSSSDFAQAANYFHPDELAAFQDALWPIVEMGMADTTRRDVLQMFNMEFQIADGQVQRVAPDSFFAAFMQSVSKNIPNFQEALASAKGEPIGGVPEGDTLYHLVYRARAQAMGGELTAIETASFKRYEGGWKIMMTAELKGMAEGIRRALMGQEG